MQWELRDSVGKTYNAEITAPCHDIDHNTPVLNQGHTATSQVEFEIPEAANGLVLAYQGLQPGPNEPELQIILPG
jgi:hypothetical protein